MYNVENLVAETIDSLKKNNCNFEVLLIDDGSTDDTVVRAKLAVNDDGRFRIIEKENSGVSATRNLGLKISLGEYIIFCDSDDLMTENAIDKLLNAAKETKSDLVYGGIKKFNYEKVWKTKGYEQYGAFIKGYKDVLNNPELFYTLGIHSKLIHRNLLLTNVVYFPENIRCGEDQVFLFALYINAKQIYCIGDYVYLHRNRDLTNNQKSAIQSKDENAFEFLKDIIEVLKTNRCLLNEKQGIFSDTQKREIFNKYYDRSIKYDLYPLFLRIIKYDKIKLGKSIGLILDYLKTFDKDFFNSCSTTRYWFLNVINNNIDLIPVSGFNHYRKLESYIYNQITADTKVACEKNWGQKKWRNIQSITQSNWFISFLYFLKLNIRRIVSKKKKQLLSYLAEII